MSYDVKCYELAEDFLEDTPKWSSVGSADKHRITGEMAQEIQD